MTQSVCEVALQRYRSKLIYLRRAAGTQKNYVADFTRFANYFSDRINEAQKHEIENYVNGLNCACASTQNGVINAIKFYYEKVLGRANNGYYNLERPKREFKLPDILTPGEVLNLVTKTLNLKHKALLQLTYSCALRNNEVRSIKLHHIDWKANLLKISAAKGNRDRFVPIPADTIELLKQYYIQFLHKKYNPEKLFFIGQSYGKYSAKSLQLVVKQALHRCGISKEITPHNLRHSRATHWHNNGLDIESIRRLLGHRDIKTTQVYLHTGIEDLAEMVAQADALILAKQTHGTAPAIDEAVKTLLTYIAQLKIAA